MVDYHRYTPMEIQEKMRVNDTTLGDDSLRALAGEVLSLVPSEVADQVVSGCLIHMPRHKRGGDYIGKDVLEGKSLIVLPEALRNACEEEYTWVILHEVAHFALDHKMYVSTEEREEHEREANALAAKWLEESKEIRKYYNRPRQSTQPSGD